MLITLWSTFAVASSVYPSEVQSLSGAGCTPACTICHSSNAGGSGTVVQPFGTAMMGQGLTGGSDTTGLANAYTAVVDAGTDSDGDGTADAEALAQDLDPNTGEALCDTATPQYGCLSHSPLVPGGALLGLIAVAARRRRR